MLLMEVVLVMLPHAKRAKKQCHFLPQWVHEFQGIGKSRNG